MVTPRPTPAPARSGKRSWTPTRSRPGHEHHRLSIPGQGVQTIAPLSALPAITQPVLIDGFSQPGYAGTPADRAERRPGRRRRRPDDHRPNVTVRGLDIGMCSGRRHSHLGTDATDDWITATTSAPIRPARTWWSTVISGSRFSDMGSGSRKGPLETSSEPTVTESGTRAGRNLISAATTTSESGYPGGAPMATSWRVISSGPASRVTRLCLTERSPIVAPTVES